MFACGYKLHPTTIVYFFTTYNASFFSFGVVLTWYVLLNLRISDLRRVNRTKRFNVLLEAETRLKRRCGALQVHSQLCFNIHCLLTAMNGLMKTENLSQTMLGYYSKKITCFLLAQVV